MLTIGERHLLGAHHSAPLVEIPQAVSFECHDFIKHLAVVKNSDVLARTIRSIEETRRITHNDEVEKMEITALSTASDSCIGNMSDIVTGHCD
jgi:hypothetical protein